VAQDAAYAIAERSLNASAADMVEVAWDLTEAIEHFEGIRPDLASHGLVVEAGPPPMTEATTARRCLLALLRLAADLSTEVIGIHVNPGDVGELNVHDQKVLACVRATINAATARLTGPEHLLTGTRNP